MSNLPYFKWQNILDGRCPKCQGKLLGKKAKGETYRNCEDDYCGFGITESHLLKIMRDPDHPIQQYMSEHMKDLVKINA